MRRWVTCFSARDRRFRLVRTRERFHREHIMHVQLGANGEHRLLVEVRGLRDWLVQLRWLGTGGRSVRNRLGCFKGLDNNPRHSQVVRVRLRGLRGTRGLSRRRRVRVHPLHSPVLTVRISAGGSHFRLKIQSGVSLSRQIHLLHFAFSGQCIFIPSIPYSGMGPVPMRDNQSIRQQALLPLH